MNRNLNDDASQAITIMMIKLTHYSEVRGRACRAPLAAPIIQLAVLVN